MSDNKLVSVIIPTHNMAEYLSSAIQSILGQSYPHLEIQVVDDGSTDTTKTVMKTFVSDGRVHYHYQEKRGVSSARNAGIRAAKGDYVALLDADDMWVPNKLERQVACLEQSPKVGVVYTNVSHIDSSGNPVETYQVQRYSGRITCRLLIRNFVTGCSSLIRRECLDRVGLYDETLVTSEDYDLWLRISAEYKFLYLDEVTYLYRQWPGQASNSKNERQFHEDSIRVKQNFLIKYPLLVRKKVADVAWAVSFVGRGLCIMRWEHRRMLSLRDILRALRYKPAYLPAWKALVKVLINRA